MPYDFFSVKDLLINQSFIYDWMKKQKIICEKCYYKDRDFNGFKKIKFNKTEIIIECQHTTILIYPPREDRHGAWLWKEIKAEEFDPNYVRAKPKND